MSAIKGIQEFRTILNFNQDQVSKKSVFKILNKAEIKELDYFNNQITFIENEILIGMYKIRLQFSNTLAFYESANHNKVRKLKSYGKFKIKLFEKSFSGDKEIKIVKDNRFSLQPWSKLNSEYKLSVENLSEIVCYCHRLSKLKVFI